MSLLIATALPIFLSGAPLPPAVEVALHVVPQVNAPVAASIIRVQAPATKAPAALPPPGYTPPSPTPPAATPPATPVQLSNAERDNVIARAEAALTRVKTAEGRFTQTDKVGPAEGRFYISRPGKVRFDYAAPERMHIVSDGVSVSIEEPERDAYDAVPLSSTPLGLFLRSDVDLKRDGSIKEVTRGPSSWLVTLEDATGEAEGRMVLEFRDADFELLGWRAIDGGGDETRVRLFEVKTNVKLKPQLFIVQDPADANEDRR